MKKLLKVLLPILFILSLAACGAVPNGRQETDMPKKDTANPPESTFNQTLPPASGEEIAVITTNMGVIKAKFFPQFTPETVKNFKELSKKGFYNGLTFHRVIPGFMIQGGDPDGNGTGGETYKGPGTTLKAEFRPELKHLNGALSMARSQQIDSASSQFFIVQNPDGAGFLDGQYTVFGQAFEGLDVVEKIANTKRDGSDKPLKPVVMKKVEIITLP